MPCFRSVSIDQVPLPQVYWLDLDYGSVATAALQCSQCLTALLYVEHWCEERYGCLALGNEQMLDEVMAITLAAACSV